MADTEERLNFGRMVRLTFSGLIDNKNVVFPAGLALFLIYAAIGWLMPRGDPTDVGEVMGRLLVLLPVILIAGIFGIALYVIILRTLIDGWNGTRLTLSEALQTVKAGFFPIFGIGILAGIGLCLGFLLLIIPGLFLMTAWAVVQPVVLYERWRDMFSPFKRSMELTRGSRWTIFGLFMVFFIAAVVVAVVFGVVGLVLGPLIIAVVIDPMVQTVTALISLGFVAALYQELVRIKEGGGRKVADVFE